MLDSDQDADQWPNFPPVKNILDPGYRHPLSAEERGRQALIQIDRILRGWYKWTEEILDQMDEICGDK